MGKKLIKNGFDISHFVQNFLIFATFAGCVCYALYILITPFLIFSVKNFVLYCLFYVGLFVFLLACFVIIYFILYREEVDNHYNSFFTKYPLSVIDMMTGQEFEDYLKDLYIVSGYKVTKTQASRDYGIDLIVESNGLKIGIQAKRYVKNVGIKAVQEAYAGSTCYKCDGCLVFTNSFYTKAAKETAKACGVGLIDRDHLKKFILSRHATLLGLDNKKK